MPDGVLPSYLFTRPFIRRHQRLQAAFFRANLASFTVLVNLLSLWREARVFSAEDFVACRYRRDRVRVERRADRSYQATRALQTGQALVVAAGISAALAWYAAGSQPPALGVLVAVAGVFLSAVAPLQDAGFGVSALGVSASQYRQAQDILDAPHCPTVDLPADRPDSGRPLWVLGSSGAGKTTWIEQLLGLRQQPDGSLHLTPETTAYLAQEPHLLAATVAENVRFGRAVPAARVDEILTALGLAQFATGGAREHEVLAPNQGGVSVGEARRVALARALAAPASLVVLDEPTAGMDPAVRRQVWAVIQAHAERYPVVVVTHDTDAPINPDDPVLRI